MTCCSSKGASEWGRKGSEGTLNMADAVVLARRAGAATVSQLICWDFQNITIAGLSKHRRKTKKNLVSCNCVGKIFLFDAKGQRSELVDW